MVYTHVDTHVHAHVYTHLSARPIDSCLCMHAHVRSHDCVLPPLLDSVILIVILIVFQTVIIIRLSHNCILPPLPDSVGWRRICQWPFMTGHYHPCQDLADIGVMAYIVIARYVGAISYATRVFCFNDYYNNHYGGYYDNHYNSHYHR